MPHLHDYTNDVPALAVQRALSGALGIDRQLLSFERRYSERDDLPGVRAFLRVVRITADAIVRELVSTSRQLDGDYTPDPNYEPGENPFADPNEEDEDDPIVVPLEPRISIQFIDEFEGQLRRWIDLVSAPQGRSFDSLAEPFRQLAKDIPNDDTFELVFRPVTERLYGIWFEVTDGFDRIARGLDRSLADTLDALPRLWAIEYPLLHEGDTFQHACIAHELGHIAYEARRCGEVQSQGEIVYSTAARTVRGDEENPSDLEHLEWFKELACDLLAVRMLGPAYAVALTEWTLTQNIWFHVEDSSGYYSHPRMPWRLRLLRDEVNRYVDAVSPGNAKDTQGALPTRNVLARWGHVIPEVDVPSVPALEVIETALQALRQGKASEMLGEAEYRPERFAEDLPAVWAKLEDGMAPAEAIYARDSRTRPVGVDPEAWSEPIDWRSILNGGYIYYLSHHDRPREGSPSLRRLAHDRDRLRLDACTHIQGSIELSQLHRRMGDLRGELAGLELSQD